MKNARNGVNNALTDIKNAVLAKQAALAAFRERYRGTIDELEQEMARAPAHVDVSTARARER